MFCPVCKDAKLQAAVLPADPTGLTASRCPACGGHWVAGDVYLQWVAAQGRQPGPTSAPTTDQPPPELRDSTKAKLCPACGRLLTRARVGHGLSFHLDRCGGCAGFWFDAGEWDALLARGLHDDAHHVFSDAWQADVLRDDRRHQRERLMLGKLGAADWAEAQRVKAWLDGHPHRAEILAHLTEREERG
ncbi:MAG TPA: zf-TFIIB domain-containing protein [Humisphaera sp.]